MAENMEDTEMIARISSGDLVALEAKYHFQCLTKYRNRYRSFCRQSNPQSTVDTKIARARAFVELVDKIETDIEEGTQFFYLNELHLLYTNRLQQLGKTSTVNRTDLKDRLMLHFQHFGLEDVFRKGKPTVLLFPQGIKELLEDSKLLRNFENEAFLFAKVANICRDELFKAKIGNPFLDRTKDKSFSQESSTPSLDLLFLNASVWTRYHR